MNIATYLRVSTEDQTIEPQRLELAGWIERNAFTAVGEWSDVLSGARAERPGLHQLLAHCGRGSVDAVVVAKLDRLGRSLLNVVGLVDGLTQMGVGLICVSQGIDTRKDNPCGRMMLSVLAAVAEFEKNIIRDRTKAGLRAARARGVVLGQPSKNLVPLEQRPELIRVWDASGRTGGVRALARSLGGCAPSTAARLAKECLPPG